MRELFKRKVRQFGQFPAALQGALCMTAAAFGFSIMNAVVRFASTELDPLQIAFMRNFFALLVMLPWLVRVGLKPLSSGRFKLYLTRASIGYLSMISWFTAVAFMPLTEAVSLTFTAPLFVTAGAALILKETVGWRRWSATVVGFLGVIVIIRPGILEVNWVTALPIMAALFMAASSLMVKTLTQTEDSRSIVLYLNLFLLPISLVPALFVWQWPSLTVLVLVAGVGSISVLAQLLFTLGFSRTDASIAVPFLYTQLPFIAAISFVTFGEIPDSWTLLGAAIIAASAIYIARRESRLKRG